ncbi:hypothetical protein Cri9333_4239 [Crinalium epipsammum PCC 9333]|uniref:Uncharacterized protein n=1 Tax=Crinalium epipsammum PCC 9333 TaxID=1173022 RepID=K9W3W5_9CYAN|nr:hypothetical protein [Crinalium epipsammum]AFZ15028.1 hypothetical protein Cri9333_4239 [Crinalium epipsammum PCC 9333]
MKKLMLGLGTALVVLSMSLPAMAATTYKYQVKGESAYANFEQSDRCNTTGVYVSAADSVTKVSGAPTPQKQAYLYYWKQNFCTGVYSEGYGSSNDFTSTLNKQLDSANLTGTFTITDPFTGTTKNTDVNINWTGTGDISRGNTRYHYQGAGYSSKYRSIGSDRQANVSGSVTVDGTNIVAGLTGYGGLNSSTSASLEITRR